MKLLSGLKGSPPTEILRIQQNFQMSPQSKLSLVVHQTLNYCTRTVEYKNVTHINLLVLFGIAATIVRILVYTVSYVYYTSMCKCTCSDGLKYFTLSLNTCLLALTIDCNELEYLSWCASMQLHV